MVNSYCIDFNSQQLKPQGYALTIQEIAFDHQTNASPLSGNIMFVQHDPTTKALQVAGGTLMARILAPKCQILDVLYQL